MSWKDTNITNPGTSIKYGADDMELVSRLFNGQVASIPAVTIKSTNKWGFWDNILFIRNQADSRSTTIRGQSNAPASDVTLALPPIVANDTLPALGLSQIFTANQEFDTGWLLKSQSAPGTPAASLQHYYVDSLDSHFKRKKSDGSVTDFDTQLAGLPAGTNKQIQYNNSNVFGSEAGFEYDAAVNEATIPGLTLTENLILNGTISPPQIIANTDNYNPTGLATSTTLRLNTDATRNLTGIVAQPSGTILFIHNVGSFNLVLKDETTSTAANRFAFSSDVTLAPDNSACIKYDGTTTRWRLVSTDATVTGVALLGAANVFTQEQRIQEDIQDLLFLYRPIDTAESLIDQNFNFNNSSAAETTYVDFRARLKVNTAGSETGEFDINTIIAGTKSPRLRINSTGDIDWGANLRGRLSQSGLTAPRVFTFPDADTKVAGLSVVNLFTVGQEIEEDRNTRDQLTLKQKTNVVADYSVLSSQIKNSSSAYFNAGWLKWQLAVNTAGAESTEFYTIVRNAGSNITPFKINSDGSIEFGGSNRRIKQIETGLTAQRTVTYQDRNGLVEYQNVVVTSKAFADTPYTLLVSDEVLLYDASGGNSTINLPAAATAGAGKKYVIIRTDVENGGQDLTVDANSTETIDGFLTWKLLTGEKLEIVSNGTNWISSNHSTPDKHGYFMVRGATFDRRFIAGLQNNRSQLITSTTSPAANNLWALPFIVPKVTKFDTITFWISTSDASDNARAGIYHDSGTIYPAALIFDSGDISTGSTGTKNATITAALQIFQPGLYWLAWETSATACQIRSLGNTSSLMAFGVDPAAPTTSPYYGYTIADTYGTLPDPFPGSAGVLTADPAVSAPIPALGLRAL